MMHTMFLLELDFGQLLYIYNKDSIDLFYPKWIKDLVKDYLE